MPAGDKRAKMSGREKFYMDEASKRSREAAKARRKGKQKEAASHAEAARHFVELARRARLRE